MLLLCASYRNRLTSTMHRKDWQSVCQRQWWQRDSLRLSVQGEKKVIEISLIMIRYIDQRTIKTILETQAKLCSSSIKTRTVTMPTLAFEISFGKSISFLPFELLSTISFEIPRFSEINQLHLLSCILLSRMNQLTLTKYRSCSLSRRFYRIVMRLRL